MKQTIFALTVVASACGMAYAQTNVTIYGVADVGFSRADTSTTQPTWGITSGQQNGSRLGFRGTEDLGGGMSAIFTLENGYNLDDGTQAQGRLFGRQAWVGLKVGSSALKLGRQYTPIFNAQNVVDPFSTNLAGNINNVFNPYGVRMDNTVNYSFSSGSFSSEVAYGFGELPGSLSRNRQIGANAIYRSGPVAAVVAYHNAMPATAAVVAADNKTLLVGGTYAFSVVKLAAAMASNKTENGANATIGKSRDWLLGATVPLGTNSVLASFMRHDQRDGAVGSAPLTVNGVALGGAATSGVTTAAYDFDQVALGYLHTLSKRTNLYTSIAKINAKPAAGVDAVIFNAGIRHVF